MRSLSIVVLCTVVLLQACSSKSPLSPTGEAIYYALEADTRMRSWVDACQGVSPDLKQTAWITKRNWWQRNGAFVQGADYGLAYDLVQISDTRVETGARLAIALTWNIVAEAEAELKDRLNGGNVASICKDELQRYNAGEFDLRSNDKFYNELVQLQRRQEQSGNDFQMKQASVVNATGKQYGRSFYVVEKMAQRQGCPNAQVQLLKNAWPDELYDARCNDGSYLLMRCEWGNCRITE